MYLAPSSARSVDSEERWVNVRRLTFSTLPCKRSSSSRVDASKWEKYGSRSCSDRFCEVGGKRPKIWGPDIVCAADDAIVEYSDGEVGVPLEEVLVADFNLADDEGIGSQL